MDFCTYLALSSGNVSNFQGARIFYILCQESEHYLVTNTTKQSTMTSTPSASDQPSSTSGASHAQNLVYSFCNLTVSLEDCWSELNPRCVVYVQRSTRNSPNILIKVKPDDTNNVDSSDGQLPGVDEGKGMIDGYIFNKVNREFSTALENKRYGYGACSVGMLTDSFRTNFDTFDMHEWLSGIGADMPIRSTLNEVHNFTSDPNFKPVYETKSKRTSDHTVTPSLEKERPHLPSSLLDDSSSSSSLSGAEPTGYYSPSIKKLTSVKEHIFKVVTNLHGQEQYPVSCKPESSDIGWLTDVNAVSSMNMHLINKLELWKKGFISYIDRAVTNMNLSRNVSYHQYMFATSLLPDAIAGIAHSNVPVWLMSKDRMVELVDGIGMLPLAELIQNIASYDQFGFEHHISMCSKHLYALTIHHDHCYNQTNSDDCTLDTLDVFYGLDADTVRMDIHN